MKIMRLFDSTNIGQKTPEVWQFPGYEERYVLMDQEIKRRVPGSEIVVVMSSLSDMKLRVIEQGGIRILLMPVRVNIQRRMLKIALFRSVEKMSYRMYRIVLDFLLPVRFTLKSWELINCWWYFWRIVKQEKPDIIQCCSTYDETAVVEGLIARIIGIPFILEMRSGKDSYKSLAYARGTLECYKRSAIEYALGMLATRVTTLTSEWDTICGKKCILTGNARSPLFDYVQKLSLEEVANVEKRNIDAVFSTTQGRLIVQIGRIENLKNQKLAIKATKELREGGQIVTLILVGNYSDEEPRYRREIEELLDRRTAEFVKVMPINNRNSLRYFLMEVAARRGISVLPSFMESTSRVLFEVSGYRIPGVWSAIKGIKDTLTDGKSGLFVEDRYNELELAERIQTLIRDNLMYDRISENAYRAVQKYTLDRYVALFIDLYSEIIINGRYNKPVGTYGNV